MRRIDTHLHLWDTTQLDYPLFQNGAFPELPDTYLLDDAIAEAEGTETDFIVIQAEVDHANDPVEETAWLQRTADEHPNGDRITGFIAYADLSQPDVKALLERHAQNPIFRGIRQEIWWQKPSPRPDILEEDLLANPDWRRGFTALADVNASFDLTCWHSQLGAFAAFLFEHPTIPVIVDHLGSPIANDDGAQDVWLNGINALAALPNTFMKISGLSQADPRWSIDSIRPLVDQVLEAFGPERCMLGSNFPIEKLTSTYEIVWDTYREIFSELTSEEKENLHFATAKRAYRLG